MDINILRYSLFGMEERSRGRSYFCEIYVLPSYNDCIINLHLQQLLSQIVQRPISKNTIAALPYILWLCLS